LKIKYYKEQVKKSSSTQHHIDQPESRINPVCTGRPVTGCTQVVLRRWSLQKNSHNN